MKKKILARNWNGVKKKYKDAKHYVYAYRLANGTERYSDDGEPNKTAGVPILDILRGNNLYNVLVIVTRYFGGTLLGTGGLVKAYGDVVKQALSQVKVIEKRLGVEYQLVLSYNDFRSVEHWCSLNNVIMSDISFSDEVTLHIKIIKEAEEIFLEQLKELLEGRMKISKIQNGLYV